MIFKNSIKEFFSSETFSGIDKKFLLEYYGEFLFKNEKELAEYLMSQHEAFEYDYNFGAIKIEETTFETICELFYIEFDKRGFGKYID
jgi:hypothetical protein